MDRDHVFVRPKRDSRSQLSIPFRDETHHFVSFPLRTSPVSLPACRVLVRYDRTGKRSGKVRSGGHCPIRTDDLSGVNRTL